MLRSLSRCANWIASFGRSTVEIVIMIVVEDREAREFAKKL